MLFVLMIVFINGDQKVELNAGGAVSTSVLMCEVIQSWHVSQPYVHMHIL
jgi:hypothetical protein